MIKRAQLSKRWARNYQFFSQRPQKVCKWEVRRKPFPLVNFERLEHNWLDWLDTRRIDWVVRVSWTLKVGKTDESSRKHDQSFLQKKMFQSLKFQNGNFVATKLLLFAGQASQITRKKCPTKSTNTNFSKRRGKLNNGVAAIDWVPFHGLSLIHWYNRTSQTSLFEIFYTRSASWPLFPQSSAQISLCINLIFRRSTNFSRQGQDESAETMLSWF